jgi:cytidylate kinase
MSVITISRQFGAGGKTLAQKVADKLNYKIAHEEIIEKLAEQAKVSSDVVSAFENEGRGLLRRASNFLTRQRFIDHVMDENRNYMDGEIYIDLLGEIIPEMADEGNIIILGRGSQFILKGRKDAYHVLLVAERDDRVRFMREQYGLSQEKAREAVDRQGERREALMRLFKRGDYDDATHYNMVINQSKMDLDMAAELVCEMVNNAAR